MPRASAAPPERTSVDELQSDLAEALDLDLGDDLGTDLQEDSDYVSENSERYYGRGILPPCDDCRRRKKRCDGLSPCETCRRAGVRYHLSSSQSNTKTSLTAPLYIFDDGYAGARRTRTISWRIRRTYPISQSHGGREFACEVST
ncbi:hypothetical protein CALCODRAFT_373968 [Calocera cornea HHB12733]|uniref:Zn(2)-C6 fungal-type domain-containing protein n=1 Tax=Calocera cornea HHB12733 TaxID=1353952 RepID=A0A165EEY0_9BASI|nr:hypothetical protein CALCODRAFT_373968 [Calocera cornea HHB12733]